MLCLCHSCCWKHLSLNSGEAGRGNVTVLLFASLIIEDDLMVEFKPVNNDYEELNEKNKFSQTTGSSGTSLQFILILVLH